MPAKALSQLATEDSSTGSSLIGKGEEKCAICHAKLGKRHMNPRHVCKFCGRCVCGGCSPSQIQLSSEGSVLHRACRACVSNTFETSQLKPKLFLIAQQLCDTFGVEAPKAPGDIEEAVALCDRAADAAEQRLREMGQSKGKAVASYKKTKEALQDKTALLSACEQSLAEAEAKVLTVQQEHHTLAEALSLCEDSLQQSEERATQQNSETLEVVLHLLEQMEGMGRQPEAAGLAKRDAEKNHTTVKEALALCESSLHKHQQEWKEQQQHEGVRRAPQMSPSDERHPPENANSPSPSCPPTPASSFGGSSLANDNRRGQACGRGIFCFGLK